MRISTGFSRHSPERRKELAVKGGKARQKQKKKEAEAFNKALDEIQKADRRDQVRGLNSFIYGE